MTAPTQKRWHIAKAQTEQCQIVTSAELEALGDADKQEVWGPFDSQGDAISRRVGLIRAGKCKPA